MTSLWLPLSELSLTNNLKMTSLLTVHMGVLIDRHPLNDVITTAQPGPAPFPDRGRVFL